MNENSNALTVKFPPPIIETHNVVDLSHYFDINEMDWVCIADNLDKSHLFHLHILCSSSYNSVWCLGSRMESVPWVVILNYLDIDLVKMILQNLSQSKQILFYF